MRKRCVSVEVLVRPDEEMTHGFFKLCHAKPRPEIVPSYLYDGFYSNGAAWLSPCQTAAVCSCWLWQRVQEVNHFLEWYLSFNPLCHIPHFQKGQRVIQERNLHLDLFFFFLVWPSWYHVWVRFSDGKTDNPGEMEEKCKISFVFGRDKSFNYRSASLKYKEENWLNYIHN